MQLWLWMVAVFVLTMVAALWVEHDRGSRGDYRRLDLPATRRGRPKPVGFDHTVGPCLYDIAPDARPELTGFSRRFRLAAAHRLLSRPA